MSEKSHAENSDFFPSVKAYSEEIGWHPGEPNRLLVWFFG